MLNNYRKISVKNLSEHCGLATPSIQEQQLTLDSPAVLLMSDFSKNAATTASESISVSNALELMRTNRIRALMIIGYNGEFSGVVTALDMMGRKPMLYANEAGIPLTDVLIKNIMLPKFKLKAISLKEVEKARIGDILHTLTSLNEQHMLQISSVHWVFP